MSARPPRTAEYRRHAVCSDARSLPERPLLRCVPPHRRDRNASRPGAGAPRSAAGEVGQPGKVYCSTQRVIRKRTRKQHAEGASSWIGVPRRPGGEGFRAMSAGRPDNSGRSPDSFVRNRLTQLRTWFSSLDLRCCASSRFFQGRTEPSRHILGLCRTARVARQRVARLAGDESRIPHTRPVDATWCRHPSALGPIG